MSPGAPAQALDALVILDAGDAFADSPMLAPDRLDGARKTAELIVDRFSAEGMKAQLIGDRDLALGREFLVGLKKRATYPLIATNLVDAATKQPVFEPYAIVDAAGVKVGVVGLIATSPGRAPTMEQEKLELAPLVDSAKAAVAALKQQGAELIVALSQLTPTDESLVAEAVPEIQLYLGGDLMSGAQEPQAVAKAFSVPGGQKGKQLAIATVDLQDPVGAGAPLVDPHLKQSLERKRQEATQRITSYERLLEEGKARLATEPPAMPGQPRRSPVEAYERQLAAARAELALAEQGLKDLPADVKGLAARNGLSFELVQLSRSVSDDPAVLKLVEEFRKTVPDPTPGH